MKNNGTQNSYRKNGTHVISNETSNYRKGIRKSGLEGLQARESQENGDEVKTNRTAATRTLSYRTSNNNMTRA